MLLNTTLEVNPLVKLLPSSGLAAIISTPPPIKLLILNTSKLND